MLGWAARLVAIGLACLTVLLCVTGLPGRLGLVGVAIELSRALPQIIAGYGVIPTPLGGIFRFDFALLVVVLFVFDFICTRISFELRHR
nr:hypothetical protein [Collinsella urealyticum]